LRKQFILDQINGVLTLQIPAIDDNDVTYINGNKIGQTNGWDKKRSYQIPAEILKIGKNVIAIRVEDTGGGGGIYGNENELKLTQNNKEIPLNGKWKFQVEFIQNSLNPNEFPSLCYNAMIHPLIPFAFKGVLWYQGESNASRAYQYQKAFPLLINDWRQKWQNEFPFYYVQLATYKTNGNSNEGCDWAELREAQTKTLSVKNTAMVVTTDVGNPNDIHPKNKKTVGKRLASIASNHIDHENVICSGPTYLSFKNIENQTIVTFESIGKGLYTTSSDGFVNGFEVADDDQIFYIAKAFIKDNKVIISCEKVLNPVAVRFGWIGDASH
jgi:sialate O-acetylesterase